MHLSHLSPVKWALNPPLQARHREGLETHSTAFLAVPGRCLSAFRKQVFLGPGDAQHMQGSPFHPQKALSSSLSQRTVAGAVEEEARFEPRL